MRGLEKTLQYSLSAKFNYLMRLFPSPKNRIMRGPGVGSLKIQILSMFRVRNVHVEIGRYVVKLDQKCAHIVIE